MAPQKSEPGCTCQEAGAERSDGPRSCRGRSSAPLTCASLALLLLFWQWRPIGIEIWSSDNAAARGVLWGLFAAGWATVLVTFLINHFDLFGLRQVWLPLIGKPYTRVPFRTPLPYRYMRHPLYLGFLLAF